ncbi:MAG: hypothetical protein KatS3mg061_0082 [Dehalococcoidia bacterium]|nr:MAG: hypothetical protein KatS3mg061_0082 [Dehalococcoidia bacterium]
MSARAAWRLETIGFSRVFRYTAGKAEWFANGLPRAGSQATIPRAGDVAQQAVPTCSPTDLATAVRAQLEARGEPLALVVTAERVVVGCVLLTALPAAGDTSVEALMEPGPATTRSNVPLAEIAARLRQREVASVIVTDTDGRLIGSLRREDAERRLLGQPLPARPADPR